MNGMHGIIFSYDKENGLRELIENRVHGSIPFGGDYRIIDFNPRRRRSRGQLSAAGG